MGDLLETIRQLINRQVTDLIEATVEKFKHLNIQSVEDVRACPERLVVFSPSMQKLRVPLKTLLWTKFYQHHRVMRMADRARRFIGQLFALYLEKPEILPNTTRARVRAGEPARHRRERRTGARRDLARR